MRNRSSYSLPIRVNPEQGEDLSSLIMRTAAQMHYTNPLWIVHPQEMDKRIETRNLCLLWKSSDYQILQSLLNLDVEKLYQCTYHRFASQLQPLEKWHLEGAIARPLLSYGNTNGNFHPFSTARVCPLCLGEGTSYGRLYWNFRLLVTCPKHNIFLIHQCPNCHKSIPTMRSSITHCPHCIVGDYRQAQREVAKGGHFFQIGQELILHNLLGESVKQYYDTSLLEKSPLLGLVPSNYFLLLTTFFKALSPLFPDHPFLQVIPEIRSQLRQTKEMHIPLSPYERIALTETFHYIFTSWPKHFFAFLDALTQIKEQEGIVGSERWDFRILSNELYNNLTNSTFIFLREAFESYLKTRSLGESRIPHSERYFVVISYAQIKLGIAKSEAEFLIRQGWLRAVQVPIRVQSMTMATRIERASVERLQKEWEGLIPLYRVTYILLKAEGATMHILHEKGWLTPVRGPDIDGYPIEMYRDVNVNAFITAFLSQTIKNPHVTGESISLCMLAENCIVAFGDVLDAIFEGKLIPVDTGTTQPLFQRVILSLADIHHWLNSL